MSYILGIDTSNYTTSASLVQNGKIIKNEKIPLFVGEGQRGLRQSDAVFLHIKNLPEIFERIFDGGEYPISAVGYSFAPRDEKGSYMPCFLAGKTAAFAVAKSNNVPVFEFSHQAGHVMAAAYTSEKKLLEKTFLAFHISGGTSELLYVEPNDEKIITVKKIGGSIDLNAGQLVDRIGVMLGYDFPAGKHMEKLAKNHAEFLKKDIKLSVNGMECNLSGAQNIAEKMHKNGENPEKIARFVIDFIKYTLLKITKNAKAIYGDIPVLFCGGVMSCSIIKEFLEKEVNGIFSLPEYSADNAVGNALLTYEKFLRKGS